MNVYTEQIAQAMKQQNKTLTGDTSLALPEFETPPKNPFPLFLEWLARAEELAVVEAKAFCLATVDVQGQPSTRTVILKNVDRSGLLFVSNYQSRKGQQVNHHPYVSATFYWRELIQQVHIEGKVEKTGTEQSDELFYARPYPAQAAASVSQQSASLVDEAHLLKKAAILEEQNNPIPRPEQWGGYRLIPHRFEFWHGRKNRLHRRLEYTRQQDQWIHRRLQP